MMNDEFDSKLMAIQVRGGSIWYAYRANIGVLYEIRRVSTIDLAKLRSTIRNDRVSSSATVQLLTHRYRDSHFKQDGKRATPCSTKERDLVPLTPFAL